MTDLYKLSKETGISYHTLYDRVKIKGMNIKDALYQGSYKNCFYLKDGRLVYKLLNHTQYDMFIRRINKGMNINEAYQDVLKCSGRTQKWNGTKYWVDGIPLSEYCKKHNLSYYTELKRRKNDNK